MKLIKVFGLAMVAAVVAMALIGASSASAASQACYNALPTGGENCPAGTKLETAEVEFVGTNPELKISETEKITCGTIKIVIRLAQVGGALTITSASITWTACKATVSNCKEGATVTTPTEKITGEIKWLSTAKKGTFETTLVNPITEVKLTCLGVPVTCKYAEKQTLIAKGSNEPVEKEVPPKPVIELNEKVPTNSGFPCPSGTEIATVKEEKVVKGKVGGKEVTGGLAYIGKA